MPEGGSAAVAPHAAGSKPAGEDTCLLNAVRTLHSLPGLADEVRAHWHQKNTSSTCTACHLEAYQSTKCDGNMMFTSSSWQSRTAYEAAAWESGWERRQRSASDARAVAQPQTHLHTRHASRCPSLDDMSWQQPLKRWPSRRRWVSPDAQSAGKRSIESERDNSPSCRGHRSCSWLGLSTMVMTAKGVSTMSSNSTNSFTCPVRMAVPNGTSCAA